MTPKTLTFDQLEKLGDMVASGAVSFQEDATALRGTFKVGLLADIYAFVAALEIGTKLLVQRAASRFPSRPRIEIETQGLTEVPPAVRRNLEGAIANVPHFAATEAAHAIHAHKPEIVIVNTEEQLELPFPR